MWSGVSPRVALPLLLGGAACHGWLLSELYPGAAVLWWGLAGGVAVITVCLAAAQWRRTTRIADALAGRAIPDPRLSEEVDRVAAEVDDFGAWPVMAVSVAVFGLAATGVSATVHRGDWTFAAPVAGIVLYAAGVVLLLRRRNRQVRRWLGDRPRQPDWRSVPPA